MKSFVRLAALTPHRREGIVTLRVPGPQAELVVDSLIYGIEDAEFVIPGQILADIAVAGTPTRAPGGSVTLAIEALTILE